MTTIINQGDTIALRDLVDETIRDLERLRGTLAALPAKEATLR